MRYLLDTNTVSHLMRANPAALARLSRHRPGEVFISAVTEAEIRFGLAKNPAATALRVAVDSLLERVRILAFTSRTAGAYGALRATLEASGMPMSPLDTLIAATAVEHNQNPPGMILVTNDHAFTRLADLAVEDWTLPLEDAAP